MSRALEIDRLTISFPNGLETNTVVHGVSVAVDDGEIVGLVGESGSGKSLTAMSALSLLPNNAAIGAEAIRVAGSDMLVATESEKRLLRGKDIALVPQEPMNSLNPAMKISSQLELVILSHQDIDRKAARDVASKYLEKMLIHDVERVLDSYPFELSGGMRQRVLLAMAFSCEPKVIIADEPTTALDVTVQNEVLQLLRTAARETETAVLFITHDLAVVWELCDRVYVMCNGQIVESGDTATVIGSPSHQYTRTLLSSLPSNSPPRTSLPVNGEGDLRE